MEKGKESRRSSCEERDMVRDKLKEIETHSKKERLKKRGRHTLKERDTH
jgi:hypothetical protein